jgi:hypothetical protein
MNFKRANVMLGSLLACVFLSGMAQAAVNPAGIAFNRTTNVGLFANRTALLVTGRCNVYDAAFANARARRAEVLAYLNAVERPDRPVCALDKKFYMNDYGRVPLWPKPSYGQRINFAGHHLTDMRPGSPWILHIVRHVEGLMREGKVDGVFLDVVGARLWSQLANWNSWPQAEKNLWTDGNVDLVRRLDARRKAIKPKFIIMSNAVWDRGDTRGTPGERYVDGVTFEHSSAYSQWHKNYASRKFGTLGHRRVLVIAKSTTEAHIWAKHPGITHITDQKIYSYPNRPLFPFRALYDR